MAQPQDKPTRVAADLLDSAAAEGARNSRSAKQQLDHWARVGRAIDTHPKFSQRRIEAVLRGDLPMRDVTEEERAVVNAEIDANIERRIRETNLAEELHKRGRAVVGMDAHGAIIRYLPDGTQIKLEE